MWMFSPNKICDVTDLFELVYWEIKLTEMTTFTNQCPGENKKPKNVVFYKKASSWLFLLYWYFKVSNDEEERQI
jgi:hypothetical protein